MKQFSKEENDIRGEIRLLYNSGHCCEALEKSKDFLLKFPISLLARYSYAVMSGDYASDIKHSEKEKENLLKIAKLGISELYNDPSLRDYPRKFQKSVKNEYFWFHEMPEEQYNLGLNELEFDPAGGHYSACVGASMLALKKILNQNLQEGETWARKSLHHFHEFENLSPAWHNINYFGSQAVACLGHYEEALEVYKAMFKKQGQAVQNSELENFLKLIEKIKKHRQM